MDQAYNEGDVVRIIAPDYVKQEELIEKIGFNDQMEESIGLLLTVDHSTINKGHRCYFLNGSPWVWAEEWLQLEYPYWSSRSITDEDFESVLI